MTKPDGQEILDSTVDAFKESVGREPTASEANDIARVVAQEVHDQLKDKK